MTSCSDHFAPVATGYARHRPDYPPRLFVWLARLAPHHRLAWDCATGTGQAACSLAAHFRQVLASDASKAQIGEARACDRVSYRVAPAEHSGLPDQSVALITVAQALHWFNLPAFYEEVRRVLSANGVIAVWSYGLLGTQDARIDAVLASFHDDLLGPHWPEARRHVVTGYRELAFPFATIESPEFAMQCHWNLDDLMGYLGTWSAVARCRSATGSDPLADLSGQLAPLWGDAREARTVRWPLTLRAGRLSAGPGHA